MKKKKKNIYNKLKFLALHLVHSGGYLEIEAHNLYGLLECRSTYKIMKENMGQSLPFILTRSTFPGSGAFTFHWTGDNLSTYDFLKISIPSIFNFNVINFKNE